MGLSCNTRHHPWISVALFLGVCVYGGCNSHIFFLILYNPYNDNLYIYWLSNWLLCVNNRSNTAMIISTVKTVAAAMTGTDNVQVYKISGRPLSLYILRCLRTAKDIRSLWFSAGSHPIGGMRWELFLEEDLQRNDWKTIQQSQCLPLWENWWRACQHSYTMNNEYHTIYRQTLVCTGSLPSGGLIVLAHVLE